MRFVGAVGIALVLGTVLATSCGDNQAPMPDQLPFDGIREFHEYCNAIGGDTTDFMPRPSAGNYSLEGVCPNPTQGPTANITFQIPQPDSIWLFVYDRTNTPPSDTLFAGLVPAGRHRYTWHNPGAEGILRIEMGTKSGFRSHGDVQFVP